jgi:hypothetical protein
MKDMRKYQDIAEAAAKMAADAFPYAPRVGATVKDSAGKTWYGVHAVRPIVDGEDAVEITIQTADLPA